MRLPLLFKKIAFEVVFFAIFSSFLNKSQSRIACIAFFPTGTILVLFPFPVTTQVLSLRSKSSTFKAQISDNLSPDEYKSSARALSLTSMEPSGLKSEVFEPSPYPLLLAIAETILVS